MSGALIVHHVGPGVSVQDPGRPGFLVQGLSRGGAADRLALAEGAALLGQSFAAAALEMAGYGGTFEAAGDMRIALTGAPMTATIDGEAVVWNASHALYAGQRISIGAVQSGMFGYLHVGGGVATKAILGSRSRHLAAGIGAQIAPGDRLAIGNDPAPERAGLRITPRARFSGGIVRIVQSPQTALFPPVDRTRFEQTVFTRTPHGNRQGVQLAMDAAPFQAEGQLSIISQTIVPGDIQMTGDGTPFVLLPECQTTGGYPRIGTVIPADLPIVAQAGIGAPLQFRFLTLAQALETWRTDDQLVADLRRGVEPLIRDPKDIRDLLGYQLIGGMVDAKA